MNNNRLVAWVGFFLCTISLLMLVTGAIADVRMCLVVGLALMLGGMVNDILGGE